MKTHFFLKPSIRLTSYITILYAVTFLVVVTSINISHGALYCVLATVLFVDAARIVRRHAILKSTQAITEIVIQDITQHQWLLTTVAEQHISVICKKVSYCLPGVFKIDTYCTSTQKHCPVFIASDMLSPEDRHQLWLTAKLS